MIRLYLWFCRVLFCCTRTMGAVGTRPSLRPLSFGGRFASMPRADRAARTRNCAQKPGLVMTAALLFDN